MKLRDKATIRDEVLTRKKSQIDEGVFIAKKVDILREEMVSLEAQRERFIAGSQKELELATRTLHDRKDELEQVVATLQKKRDKLLEPINKELAELEEARRVQEIEKIAINEKWDDLNEREAIVEREEKLLEEDYTHLLDVDKVTKHNEEKAKLLLSTAESIHKGVLIFKETEEKDISKRTKELSKKEKETQNRQAYLDIQKDNLDHREQKLNDRERAIDDKWGTLQRTIRRLNK